MKQSGNPAREQLISIFVSFSGYSNKLIIPFSSNLENCHVKSKASSVDTKRKMLTLENEQTVEYTDLVIACGTSSPFPGKLGLDNPTLTNEAILQKYDDLRKKVRL